MIDLRFVLVLTLLGWAGPLFADDAPVSWGDDNWALEIDPATGALDRLENKHDPQHMDWFREPGHWDKRNWLPDASPGAPPVEAQWGLVTTAASGLLSHAQVRRVSDRAWEAVYTSAPLTVTVQRQLSADGDLVETYTFANTGTTDLDLPAGSVSITAPFFDQYPDADSSLAKRCDTHLWMGGSSAWVNALRMGAAPPHLGLVVTQGSLDSYSQTGGGVNDRGIFLLHPGAMTLKPGARATFAWKLFWHEGWDDFFSKVAATPGFVRLTAKDYVVTTGQSLEVTADSADSLDGAKLLANGQPVDALIKGAHLTASIPAAAPGDLTVVLDQGGRQSVLRAFVTPPVDQLIAARVKFIVRKQQKNAPGDPLDGAYLAYDNETGAQVYSAKVSDHNAGRERVAMGVLGALYLPLCQDAAFQAELKASLERYNAFLCRELEDDNGVVYGSIGRKNSKRIYNFPWVADFHLAMFEATGDPQQLDRYVRVVRAYYASPKALVFYPIGMPIARGLKALARAGRTAEHDELLGKFRAHADYVLKNGVHYPRSEVNFEQSIVAPGVQILAEFAYVTGEKPYLDGAKVQMPVLEAFAGQQPDSRLNEISIRHWDDFWFGKIHVFGDTLPHYWSTVNAIAYTYYGLDTKDPRWLERAQRIVDGNLSLFTPDGAGSAAHLYAVTTAGVAGARNDPWANDQDWALVNLLRVRELAGHKD